MSTQFTAALAALFCLLTACAPRVTPCGVRLAPGWLSDADVRAAERELLERGPKTTHPALKSADLICAALQDTVVQPVSGRIDVRGKDSDGEAYCDPKYIRVSYAGRWQFSSLAHELMHVLTGCDDHVGWTATGINQQLINIYFLAVPDKRTP